MGITNCIDAGTPYCPCYLAETGECIMCSQLQGEVFCACLNWQGVCIYQEYIWHNSRRREDRQIALYEILNCTPRGTNVIIARIQVELSLARELKQPGAYVFLRAPYNPEFFDLPMSILQADESSGIIEIAVQKRGVKTKCLLEKLAEGKVFLRGPYWNGILGLKHLKTQQKGKTILVVRGIGQAPAVSVARKLRQGANEVLVLLDKGRTKADFTGPLFQELGCKVEYINLLNPQDWSLTEKAAVYLKKYLTKTKCDLLYAGGSDLLHQQIFDLLISLKQKIKFVCSNNAQLCCGEGVCGSCQTRLTDGRRVKRCKTQLEPASIYQGGETNG